MKKCFIILLILFVQQSFAQNITQQLNKNWQFARAGTNKWFPAVVPGSVYTDLFRNKLTADPFFSDNEKRLQWVDSCDWIYRSSFIITDQLKVNKEIYICFEGLDTYADVYLNNKLVLRTDNMFRYWNINLIKMLKPGRNGLKIIFHSAQLMIDSIAKARLPIMLPDNNRVYARKAQYQFGWDWGPKFLGCGIWRKIYFAENAKKQITTAKTDSIEYPFAKLIQQKDSVGESFYFENDGKPIYIKGANWIPANIFPAAVTHDEYRKLLLHAKDAHMNMLRVWGGGIYEDDYFYDLCDSLHIMVWQDFMFAGGMYPGDKTFLQNVKEEVRYQISRLKDHPCIVLWCGNNEIDEAWHNWGWQEQYNIHNADSAKLWQNYKILFADSLRTWVKEFDGTRAYIPSSPKYGWGHDESFTEGDSHYWGLWWGLEPWESFETHTGRFVSEYGMQSMSNYTTIKNYVPANDLHYSSAAVQWHQKANEGFYKLNFYLDKYFIDSAKLKELSLEQYSYLTQCLQYYILKNSIAVQRSKAPHNMGTLLWQLDDCWPATSWSITDFSRAPKAAWYVVREAYRDDVQPLRDSIYPKKLALQKAKYSLVMKDSHSFYITAFTDLKYISLETSGDIIFSDNYFDLVKGGKKLITFEHNKALSQKELESITVHTLNDILSP